MFVKIDVGVQINIWFLYSEEMNLDLLPEDVDSIAKAEAIINFMQDLAMLLKKRVLLTAENASADRDWSEQHCIFSVSATDVRDVIYHPEIGDWSRY